MKYQQPFLNLKYCCLCTWHNDKKVSFRCHRHSLPTRSTHSITKYSESVTKHSRTLPQWGVLEIFTCMTFHFGPSVCAVHCVCNVWCQETVFRYNFNTSSETMALSEHRSKHHRAGMRDCFCTRCTFSHDHMPTEDKAPERLQWILPSEVYKNNLKSFDWHKIETFYIYSIYNIRKLI